jgi:hypothetical protein
VLLDRAAGYITRELEATLGVGYQDPKMLNAGLSGLYSGGDLWTDREGRLWAGSVRTRAGLAWA